MSLKIGFITAAGSLPNILKADKRMKKFAQITYLPYTSLAELVRLYMDNEKRMDGFIFSGRFPKDYLEKLNGKLSKPYVFIEPKESDYYKMFAKLLIAHPELDFSKVYIDKPDNMAVIDELFPKNKRPVCKEIEVESVYENNISGMYKFSWDLYMDLWKTGGIRLFITRLTNLADQLDKNNIPYILMVPSEETVMEYFVELLRCIQNKTLENSLIATCLIDIAKDNPSEGDYQLLEKKLKDFNAGKSMTLVISREENSFNITTNNENLNEITNSLTTCFLTSYLYDSLPFHTHIGWGTGCDIITAHKNAHKALLESRRDKRSYTYLVNQDKKLIGPLTGDRSIRYVIEPDKNLQALAGALGISLMHLNKLYYLQEKQHMNEFSSGDLVYYLDITLRSANRILKILEEHGAAKPERKAHLSDKGRPSTIYSIDLNNADISSEEKK